MRCSLFCDFACQACSIQFICMLQDLTWLKQFLSKIINTKSAADPTSRSLCIPVTVSTRWSSINLQGTSSGMARATYLPMLLLNEHHTLKVWDIVTVLTAFTRYDGMWCSAPQACKVFTICIRRICIGTSVQGPSMLQVVLDIAQHSASTEGHQFPDELPSEAREAWRNVHCMLGGNPRLLFYALRLIGRKRSAYMGQLQPGREWNRGTLTPLTLHFVVFSCFAAHMQSCKEFETPYCENAAGVHHRILGLKSNSVSALVTEVSNAAVRSGFWPRRSGNVEMNLQVLKRILAAIALDQTVSRRERIVPEDRALTATWGSEEERGAIQLNLPVRC